MSSSAVNEASFYETLLLLYDNDREKALSVFSSVSHAFDISEPIQSFLPEVSSIIGLDADSILEAWMIVERSFVNETDYTIIPRRSPLYPASTTDDFPFIYASSNTDALKYPYVAFMGTHQPSVKGRSDELDAISELVESGVGVLAPLEKGAASYALSYALKLGGRAIAVMETPLSKCAYEDLSRLQTDIIHSGLLLSVFAPHIKSEKWHKKIRNSFIASISSSIFIAEEKDGGGSWSVASSIMDRGGSLMISQSLKDNPALSFPRKFIERGALTFRKNHDIKKIIKKNHSQASSPDLFS